jgi:Thrombospondin type 3 repeat
VKSPQDRSAVDTTKFVAVSLGRVLPIKFGIERRAADQDGDGVPDWRDNCPTIYNPPVRVPVLPARPVTPTRCDYNTSDCDPQELDSTRFASWQQVRGTPQATPFLGIQISDAAGNPTGGEHWLIGLPGYTTGYPANDTVTPVVSDGNWAYTSKSFTMDARTSDIVIKDENFGSGDADFDQIQLWAGACPAAPTDLCAAPTPSCTAPSCTAGVCSSAKL